MRGRKRWKNNRRIVGLFVIGLCFAYWYFGLLPGKLNDLGTEKIREITGINISFDKIHYLPLKGIHLKNVQVSTPNKPTHFIDSLILRINAWKLLTKKEWEILYVELKGVKSQVSITPIQEYILYGETQSLHSSALVLIAGFIHDSIENRSIQWGDIVIRDSNLKLITSPNTKSPIETLSEFNLSVQLRQFSSIPYQTRFQFDNAKSKLAAMGKINTLEQTLDLRGRGHVRNIPHWLINLPIMTPIQIEKIDSDYEINVLSQNSITNLDIQSQKTTLEGQWTHIPFKTEFSQNIQSQYRADESEFKIQSGSIHFDKTQIMNLIPEKIDDLSNMSGNIRIQENALEFKGVKGLWNSTPFKLEGWIDKNDNPTVSMQFSHQAHNIQSWKPFLPDNLKKSTILNSLKGNLQISSDLKGPIDQITQQFPPSELIINKGSLSLPRFKVDAENINSRIELTANSYRVRSGSLSLVGHPLQITGHLHRSEKTLSEIKIKHPLASLRSKFLWKREVIDLKSLHLQSLDSIIDIDGTIQLSDKPIFNLSGNGHLELEEIREWMGNRWVHLQKIEPKGRLSPQFNITGLLDNWNSLESNFKIQSEHLLLFNMIEVADSEIDGTYQNNKLNISYAKSNFYQGEIRGKLNADLSEMGNPYFDTNLFSYDIDLEKLASHLKKMNVDFLSKKFSGSLNMDVTAQGYLNNHESITGLGHFQILGGHIWETPLFKKLHQLPFVTIEGMDKLLFNQANGSFRIEKGYLIFDDTVMSSRQIDIHLRGKMDFDTNLDLDIISRFSSGLIHETEALGGLAPDVIYKAESMITQYHLSGSLLQPLFQEQ